MFIRVLTSSVTIDKKPGSEKNNYRNFYFIQIPTTQDSSVLRTTMIAAEKGWKNDQTQSLLYYFDKLIQAL